MCDLGQAAVPELQPWLCPALGVCWGVFYRGKSQQHPAQCPRTLHLELGMKHGRLSSFPLQALNSGLVFSPSVPIFLLLIPLGAGEKVPCAVWGLRGDLNQRLR